MMRNFNDVLAEARKRKKNIMVIPDPRSTRVLTTIDKASKSGLISPVLVGNGSLIRENLAALKIDTEKYKIIDEQDSSRALAKSINLLHKNEAGMIFQGDIDIKEFMKAVTDNDGGITETESLSYVSLFELPSQDRITLLTDTYIQEFPDLRQKVKILTNAISLANSLGIEKPKVAALSLVELVNPAFTSTLDAAVLSKMSERRQINAIIDGPLDIDCASSLERARRKGVDSPVSGEVDIYLLPDIESGYSVVEIMVFLGKAMTAGALMGSNIPIILNLKFETTDSILLDIALATLRYQ